MFKRDVAAGLFLVTAGILALTLVYRQAGDPILTEEATYFPRIIGIAILGIGVFVTLQALRSGVMMEAWAWRPLCALVAGSLAFGILVQFAGLAFAAGGSAFIGSLAAPFPGWKQRIATVVAIAVCAVIVFTYLLGLNIRLWPSWIS